MRFLAVVALLAAVGCVSPPDEGGQEFVPQKRGDDSGQLSENQPPSDGGAADAGKRLPDTSAWDFCSGALQDLSVAACPPAYSEDEGAFVQCYGPGVGWLSGCKLAQFSGGVRTNLNCTVVCPY